MSEPATPQRLPLVDALRGIAVVAMVYIHVEHAFADPQRIPFAFAAASNFFGGWAAPTFLLLAGLSSAWASARTSARTLAWRGCEVWLWAMGFRLQEWVLGGSGARAADMLRVDVLNCIGLSLILVAGALALTRRAYAFALIGAVFFAATPWIRASTLLDPLPPQLAWYVAGPQQMTPFPLFGWAGFAFFGAALGLIATGPNRNRILLRAAAIGALTYVPVYLVRSYWPGTVGYACNDFNPYNMVERLALATALFALANALKPLHTWLVRLGRHSLIIYWVHVELCYGMLFYHWQQTAGMAAVLAIATAMMLAMTILASGQERLLDWAQTMLPKRSVRA